MATGAAVAGVMLFWDVEVFAEIFTFFTTRPFMLICLVVTLFASYKFITMDKNKK